MKHQIILCILLILISSVDMAAAKSRKKKKTKKITRTEQYEEIENFDFLYANEYDTNVSFANVGDILEQATSKIGARYRSGSKGPKTFDCSGFTSYVFKQMGETNIGASSREQYSRNMPVSRSEMKRGDLVFFSYDGCYTTFHVALYIGG